MIIYSHRGIDFDRSEKFPENSLAAFEWAAKNNLGIELDLQLTRDQELVVAHDPDLLKWSAGEDKRTWSSLTIEEIRQIKSGTLTTFEQVLQLAETYANFEMAVHLKGANQTPMFVAKVIAAFQAHPKVHTRTFIFDLKPEVGATLRKALPKIGLGPSVADPYDISRFQKLTGGTLFSLEEILPMNDVFNWIWLDEWDLKSANGSSKSLYSPEVMNRIRKSGFKIALISPELHRGEDHPDGRDIQSLEKRWGSIVALQPDAICSDYPARLLLSLKTS